MQIKMPCIPVLHAQRRKRGLAAKIMLAMKMMPILLLVTALHVSARGTAQKITYSAKSVALQKLFAVVKQQTGYLFFYENATLKDTKPITVAFKETPLVNVLQEVLTKQHLDFDIQGNTISITRKEAEKADPTPPKENVYQASPPRIDSIHGKVLDENGKPAQSVTVSIRGSRKITITDNNGAFTIGADKAKDVLVFTSVGMETQEIDLNDRTEVAITLKTKVSDLEQVVVNTGYQTVKKEIMTGATVTVGSADLEKRYTPNIIDNLEGRIPGLINYRGTTQIRGVSSINASTAALVVVDGLPIEGTIANINPYDVESITVLKDAAAAAIYGIRASNGVIVVTTKRAKDRRTAVEFSSDVTVTDKPNLDYNLLTPAQQVDLESTFYGAYFGGTTTGVSAATAITTTTNNIKAGNAITPVQYGYYQLAQGLITQSQLTNRLDSFKQNNFRQQYKDNALLNGVLQQYNFAIRTNSGKSQSSLVLNYKTDNTGIINAYNNQLNIFYKGTYNASKWLDVNYGVNMVLGMAKASNSSFATSATNVSPYLRLLDANGNRNYYTTGDYNIYTTTPAASATTPTIQSMLVNHLDELGLDSRKTQTQNIRYYVNLNFKIIPGLTFNPSFQYESNQNNVSAYSEANSYITRYLKNAFIATSTTAPGYTYLLPTNGGKLATSQTNGNYWTARGQVDYSRRFGLHEINVIAGTEFRQTRTNGNRNLLLGYDDQLQSQSTTAVSYPALQALTSNTFFKPASTYVASLYNTYIANAIGLVQDITHRYNSGYANATYTYNRRYNIFGSFRKDYADVFGLDPKFRGKPLWSTGVAWNINNEDFMAKTNWVNILKFRATYGVTGNIGTGVTSVLTANSGQINPITTLPLSVITNAANPQLRWEKTATTNLGLDFALFNNRLSGSLDWYRKITSDLLYTTRLDPSEGFNSLVINNGGLSNIGIEVALNYNWIKPSKKNGFSWSSMLVVSQNSNKITYVDAVSNTPALLTAGGYKTGYPVHSLFSYQYGGLNAVGQPQFLQADGKTLSTVAITDINAVVYSGGTDPKINMALTNEVHFKGFSLSILAVYYGGQYLRGVIPDYYGSPAYGSMPSYLLNSWTPTNTNTIIPGFGNGLYAPPTSAPAGHLAYSDAFVLPGDFIKIRYVSLGYFLPQQWASKIGSSRVNLHFQLNNPKSLWMKNKVNTDPETGGARVLTSYVFGLNVNF